MAALTPRPISWPISGGLDGKRSPLIMQPGSHLTLDDVTQERLHEWRNRPGFTQTALDTPSVALAPYLVGAFGSQGMAMMSAGGWSSYSPNLGSTRWSTAGMTAPETGLPQDIVRFPIVETDTAMAFGMAIAGDMILVAHNNTSRKMMVLTDRDGGLIGATLLSSAFLRLRGAATTTHLVMFGADTGGNLITYVVNASTGVVTGPTTIKTGLHATQPYLDAIWYGGSTITVVCRTSGDAVRFIEFNPSTGALATDTTIAAVSCANCLSLLHDVDASGVRFIGTSHTTPTTRVVRVNSAGAVQSDDQAEAIASTQITGVASTAGANWNVVYKTAGGIKHNSKSGGVVGTAAVLDSSTPVAQNFSSIDSMAWREVGASNWHVVLGLHSTIATDPQDTWIEFQAATGSGGSTVYPSARLVPLQAAAASTLNADLRQVVRESAYKFSMALPVRTRYIAAAGSTSSEYSIDLFTQTLLRDSDIATATIGPPLQYKATTFFPGAGLMFFGSDLVAAKLGQVGLSAPPQQPTLAQGAGGSLTLLAQYQYAIVLEHVDDDGNVWRSPPSVSQTVTLTGANNRVTVTYAHWTYDLFREYAIAIYRTSANGSLFRRITTLRTFVNAANVYVDDFADATIVGGELMYTPAELATAITPPASHLAIFNDRMWAVNRDYRTELWPTKRLRPGRQPEFIGEGVIDVDDTFGDITGLVSLDDKGVAFKRNAIYFVEGDGLEDDGSGRPHTYSQISQDIGAIAGSPIVVAGDVAYFVSERGIYSVDRSGNIDFAGAGVDKYLNQPLIQTPETVFDGCFVPAKNEVRFVTTNYILVWNITFQTWTRWTGLSGMKRCLVVNGRMVLFKSDGTVWREGDHTQTTDQGAAIAGVIRSAWVRAAGDFGQFRLYRGLATAMRTAGGASVSPTMAVYADDSDVVAQSWSPQSPIAGATTNVHLEVRPATQNMSAFSLQITLPAGDATFRIEKWGAEVGIRGGGAQKRPESERWA